MRTSENINELASALAKFQCEVRNPVSDQINPQFKSKFASLENVINTVKPVLGKYGLSFVQSLNSGEENVSVTTLLVHESGQWLESDPLTMPAYQTRAGGVKEHNAHGIAIGVTYGRRISLSAVLGLATDDDDDANGQVFGNQSSGANSSTTQDQGKANARDTAKEKAKNAAAEKAKQSTKNEDASPKEEPKDTSAPVGTNDTAGQPINEGQQRAFTNMLGMVKRKNENFDPEAFTADALKKFGKEKIEDLTFDQGRELLSLVNVAMRG